MYISLDFAGYSFRLSLDSSVWIDLITKKYRNFVTDKAPDFMINIQTSGKKNRRFAVHYISKNECALVMPDPLESFRQFNFLCKTIFASFLLNHDGVILHASSIAYKGKAILFAGKEGSGKSTIVKLVPEYPILNDDFAIIRKIENAYYLFSSPFYETNPFPKKKKIILIDRIYLLKQSSTCASVAINQDEALIQIMPLTLTPLSFIPSTWKGFPKSYSIKIGKRMFEAARDLSTSIPCFMLKFRKDRSFIQYLS